MSNLAVFNFKGQDVRFVGTINKPEWIAQDICNVLNIDRTQIRRLDDYQKGVYIIHTPGGKQEMATVTEPGLYSLIFTSRKSIAKEFQRWVFEEVLPSIRKTGQYSTNEFKEIRKPHLSIDDIEMYVGMAERLTKISHDQFRSILEDELVCLVKLQCQSESKPLDHLYTKILDKAKNGISPSQLKSYVWELRKLSLSEVHIILRTLCDLGLGYIKPQKRSYLFFRQD